MILYKFKPLTDFEFVADIIINNRLFTTKYTSLNDPMEGFFFDYREGKYKDTGIAEARKKHLVCSLSATLSDPLLWAHYADGFKGVCIEVEINESLIKPHKIDYSKDALVISYDRSDKLMGEPRPDVNEMAIQTLTRKFPDWAYEQEYRLLNHSDNPFLEDGVQVLSVTFGVNTSPIYKEIIKSILPSGVFCFESALNTWSKVVRMPNS